ncbi:MAG: ParB/RepB/Spo0J family partition protein [Clostridia bacterium]|nr:ParB/RepB/Spo0J family partition protein [Clostridia bacterium]
MKSSAKNIQLTPVDDLFSSEEIRTDANRERVIELPLEELHPFRNHPFRVVDDDKMMDTAQSIQEHGVLVPAIVRQREEGGYEIVSGHRRHHACQIAGLDTMPAIIRELDDDAATIIMVDSNLQRETLLPSERAWAYRMKLEAIRRKAGRPSSENRDQLGHNFSGKRSVDILAENAPDSRNQIQRFIRLTELIQPLMDMVDERKIAFNPAVELSYLKQEEQLELLDAMEGEQATPSLSQAQRLKKFSQEGRLSIDVMRAIMSEEKKSDLDRITLTGDKVNRYFPESYTPQQKEQVILKLLAGWYRRLQQAQER